ncbi:hypothetical protein ACT3SP_06205 [Brachybacterium sp. AOP43-C2-M15]|uniref:hypothetical protein n=1 Tax=Brachybacterium sp. AOP43-C2-M15 TaxID=3457661 RepID=UPI00403481C9
MTRTVRDRGAHGSPPAAPVVPPVVPPVLSLVVVLLVALAAWGTAPVAHADPGEEPSVPEHAYRATGPEVTGGASQAQAPLVLPGIHRDTFAQGARSEDQTLGTVKYYRIAVGNGQRVHAAATVAAPPYPDGVPPEPEDLRLSITFVTAAGDECEDRGTDDVGEWQSGDGPITSTAVSGTMSWDGCAGDELFLVVGRAGTRLADAPLPVELQVAIEPAGIGGGSPAVTEAVEDDGAAPVAPEHDEPFEAGRSFATAPEVEPGSVVLELVPGEVAAVRIEVREGQRLRWRVEETSTHEDAGELSLRVADAVRGQVTVGGGSWRMNGSDRVAGGGMTAPVDRGNRSSDLDSVASAWLPGTHTVTVQRLQRDRASETAGDAPVTVVLTLELDGEIAEDDPEGTVLELGETGVDRGLLASLGIGTSAGRLVMLAGAGALTLAGLVTGAAGVLVLRLRRR